MIRQLKYAISDVGSRKTFFAIYFLQIFISLLVVCYCISTAGDLLSFKQKLIDLGDLNKTYLLFNVTDDDYLSNNLYNAPNATTNMYAFYSFLKTSPNFETYSFYTQDAFLNDESLPDKLAIKQTNEIKAYPILYVDEKFIVNFSLQCSDGKMFDSNDFNNTNEIVPVVLGWNYKEYYEIGEVIKQKYKIVGFLEKNSFYLHPKMTNEVIYLDSYIVFPLVINAKSEVGELAMATLSTCVITDNVSDLTEIQNKSNDLNLFTFQFRSLENQLDNIIKEEMQTVQLLLALFSLILLLCLICMMSALFVFINTHMREFAIHLLCGATIFSIIYRICIQVWLVVLLSNLLVILIFHNVGLVIPITLFSFVVCIITTLPPSIKLLKTSINNIIKRSE